MDYIAFCRKFFDATKIPVSLLYNSRPVYSSLGELLHITSFEPFEIFPPSRNPGFCAISPELEYGRVLVEGTGYDVILGPSFSLPPTEPLIRQFIREAKASIEMEEQISEFFYSIPCSNHQQFCRYLALIHLCLNGKDVGVEDLYREDEEKGRSRQERHIRQEFAEDRPAVQNPYPFEQEMYQCIRSGSVAGLKELFSRPQAEWDHGKMAQSPVRHAKNIFIRTATNAGMLGAIPGGLGPEKAYRMIDSYVQECEQLKTLDEINSLQYMMVLDFCQCVSDTKLPEGISAEVYRCASFIRSNVNRPLSVEDVARQVHRSGSYMMKLFREELGIHITTFITQCRLEEAKRLLQYSDSSLAEISSYLCFSSQSYFQNVFKKQYGITPMQYRKQTAKL